MTTIFNVNPDKTCIVIPKDRSHESKEGMTATGFEVMLGKKVRCHETAAFELPGTGMKVKFTIRKATNFYGQNVEVDDSVFSSDTFITQIILVEPVDDIFLIKMNDENEGFLTSGCDSFTQIERQSEEKVSLVGAHVLNNFSYTIDIFGKIWKPEFANITPSHAQSDHVTLTVGHDEVVTNKSLLTKNSVVFRNILDEEADDEVEVSDFSVEAVHEMVRFMMHGYCGGWTKRGDELIRIADHYKVEGMMEFAGEKKKMLQALEDGTGMPWPVMKVIAKAVKAVKKWFSR